MANTTKAIPQKEEAREKGPETLLIAAPARPFRRGRQSADPHRQEARLCHTRSNQRIAGFG